MEILNKNISIINFKIWYEYQLTIEQHLTVGPYESFFQAAVIFWCKQFIFLNSYEVFYSSIWIFVTLFIQKYWHMFDNLFKFSLRVKLLWKLLNYCRASLKKFRAIFRNFVKNLPKNCCSWGGKCQHIKIITILYWASFTWHSMIAARTEHFC